MLLGAFWTTTTIALEAPDYWLLQVFKDAPKDQKFSLYADRGWYVVNDKFIDETLVKLSSVETLKGQLDRCMTETPPITTWEVIKTPAFYLSISAAAALGLAVGIASRK